jgi:type IV pilus assembly protein PilA
MPPCQFQQHPPISALQLIRRNAIGGFTLIELLVSIVIIGILASIAISQYNDYRARSFDARAISDLRNIMSAQEAYFSDNENYLATLENLTGFDKASPSVTAILAADPSSWSGSSYHPQGTTTYCYNSIAGQGIVNVTGVGSACP